MHLIIKNKEKVVVDKVVSAVHLPAKGGDMKVLTGHAPTIALIREGQITFDNEKIQVKKGVARITADEALILVD